MEQPGYLQVYIGDGKGKTTAAFGLALRAVCADLKVYIGQFLKGQAYSELRATEFLPKLTIEQFGLPGVIKGQPSEEDLLAGKRGMARAKEALESNYFDLVILDEVTTAVQVKIVEEEELLQLIDSKPENVELVLTGREAGLEILDRADLVTEMKEIKHYFHTGVLARKGIEY